MKGYKGFDKNFKCKGMQYEVGKEFSVDGELEMCKNGLHFCEYPLDVFAYYEPSISKYAEVEALGEINNENPHFDIEMDSKICTNKLKVCTEIGIPDLVHAAEEYIKDNIDTNKAQKTMSETKNIDEFSIAASTGEFSISAITTKSFPYPSIAANTGNRSLATNINSYSAATNTGKFSVATNIGFRSIASNTGDGSASTNTGDQSAAIGTGCDSVVINTGERSIATTTGKRGLAINEGCQSLATNTSNGGAAVVTGENSIAVAFGCEGVAKGSLGSWIVLSEWICGRKVGKDGGCVVKDVKCFKVDGKDILPDTFYKLVDGKPIAREE